MSTTAVMVLSFLGGLAASVMGFVVYAIFPVNPHAFENACEEDDLGIFDDEPHPATGARKRAL
jgi:hypothetical protein